MKFKGKFYCIAGHSHRDSGAVGVGGRKEKDDTIDIRDRIVYYLNRRLDILVRDGVLLEVNRLSVTVDNDWDMLSTVIAKIRPEIGSSDLLLDIHYNSASVDTATGTEVFISDNAGEGSKLFAKKVVSILSLITGLRNRGVKRESESAVGKLGILNMRGDAVLLEFSFINNPYDVEVSEKWEDWVCDEIAFLVIEHLTA